MNTNVFLIAGLASLTAACGAPKTPTPDQAAVVRVHEIVADRSTPEGRVATFGNCMAAITVNSINNEMDKPEVIYMPADLENNGMAQVIVGKSDRSFNYDDDTFRLRFGTDGKVELYAIEAYNDLYEIEGAVRSCTDAAGITAPTEGVSLSTRGRNVDRQFKLTQ